jgi:hypothetical protein
LATWIVRARRVNGVACRIENTRQSGTTRANGADFLGRAVRDLAVEYQRLLEPSKFELAPAARHFGLDLEEPPLEIKYRDHRATAVCPLNRKLTAVNPVDSGGNVELHRGALRQRRDRMIDDGLFIEPGIREISDRQFELAFVLAN